MVNKIKNKISVPTLRRNLYKKKFILKDVIMIHKIAIKDWMNNQDIDSYFTEYKKYLPIKHGELNILNIVIPIYSEEFISDIKVVYPHEFTVFKNEIFEHLNNTQKRKVKIYDLIKTL